MRISDWSSDVCSSDLATPARAPAMRSTPAFAAAPHGGMGRHEAMALAGPTPDNPFPTLKKRLQRARFPDRRQRLAYEELLSGQRALRRTPAPHGHAVGRAACRDRVGPYEQSSVGAET